VPAEKHWQLEFGAVAANRSSSSRFVLSLLVLSSITILVASPSLTSLRGKVRDSLRPARSFGGRLTAPIDDAVGKARNFRELKLENERLRRQLDEALANKYRYDDAVRNYRELLKLSKFTDPDGYKSLNARVVSLGGSNFEQEKIELDKGSDDGVVVGAPVMTASGVVGQVIKVYQSSADAALVTDPELRIGVRLAKSGDLGLSAGLSRAKGMKIDLLALGTKPEVGEIVVTSGLQKSSFPPDLPVGIVRSFKNGPLQVDVRMTPVVDVRPANLSFVKVLLIKATKAVPETTVIP
jgi:rod shape-determining protein MreC